MWFLCRHARFKKRGCCGVQLWNVVRFGDSLVTRYFIFMKKVRWESTKGQLFLFWCDGKCKHCIVLCNHQFRQKRQRSSDRRIRERSDEILPGKIYLKISASFVSTIQKRSSWNDSNQALRQSSATRDPSNEYCSRTTSYVPQLKLTSSSFAGRPPSSVGRRGKQLWDDSIRKFPLSSKFPDSIFLCNEVNERGDLQLEMRCDRKIGCCGALRAQLCFGVKSSVHSSFLNMCWRSSQV